MRGLAEYVSLPLLEVNICVSGSDPDCNHGSVSLIVPVPRISRQKQCALSLQNDS